MENFVKIGVDGWSILLYIVNYGLIFGVVGWFIYKPIRKAMDSRRETIEKSMQSAETLQSEMEAMMKEQTQNREASLAEMQAEKKALEKMLEERRQTLLAEMEQERALLLQQTHDQIAQEKDRVMHDVETRIVELVKKALFSVLSYHVPENVVQESVKKAWEGSKK